MKLKNILKEEKDKRSLRKLIKSEYQIPGRFLVRGTDRNIDKWKELSIRKDRKPLDTHPTTDVIVSAIEDCCYRDVPKRRESKFAVTSDKRTEVRKYGDHIYYCFPHKSARVVSLPKDGITYFKSHISLSLRTALTDIDYELFPATLGFVESYLALQQNQNHNRIYNYVVNYWLDMRQEMKDINYDSLNISSEAKGVLYDIQEFIESLTDYFEDMKKGVPESSPEVVFDGPKYLIVNDSFMIDNFNLRKGSFSMKR